MVRPWFGSLGPSHTLDATHYRYGVGFYCTLILGDCSSPFMANGAIISPFSQKGLRRHLRQYEYTYGLVGYRAFKYRARLITLV